MDHSNWIVVKERDHLIILSDIGPWDEHMTITNDAEHVIKVLGRCGKLHKRVFYWCSESELTELVHDGHEFTGFAFPDSSILNEE